jgi:hypothetical protein
MPMRLDEGWNQIQVRAVPWALSLHAHMYV